MKKFYLSVGLVAMATGLFAQDAIDQAHNTNVTVQPKPVYADRATNAYFIDYEGYDETFGTMESGALFFNTRQKVGFSAASPLGMADAYMVFDTMIVTTDYTVFDYFASNVVQNFLIDTAYIRMYHENNSGTNDTLVMYFKNVAANGTPGSTILWGDTIITNTSLTTPNTGNTYGFVTFAFPIGLNVPNGKFTLHVSYYGATVDTFGLISSNATLGVPCSNAAAGNEVLPSAVFPSSFYRYWNNTTLSAVSPNNTGQGGLYIDCNGNSTADWATEQAIQTWSMWVFGQLTDNTGIDEEEAGIQVQAYPNPATDFTTIKYTLANDADVTITLTDISGKVVYNTNVGNKGAGTHNTVISTTEFSNGVYMYTITANGKKVTRRIIVNK